MGSKPKTRFVVEFDGALRELLSVRELPDRSLVVLSRFEQWAVDLESGEETLRESERYSVHMSPQSTGTTLKRTVTLADGRAITSVYFVKDSKNSLLSHLYTKACPILSNRYDLRIREKDALVKIGAFSRGDFTTFIFTVLVGDATRTFPNLRDHSLVTFAFGHFEIAIYSSYLNLPATDNSVTITGATAPKRVNGIATGVRTSDGKPSIDPTDLPSLVLDSQQLCAANLVVRMVEMLPADLGKLLLDVPLWFYPDTTALAQGRLHRGI